MWAKSWTVETVGSSSCSNCITAHVHFSRHRNHHQPIIAYMMLDKRTLYVLLYQIIYVLRSSFNVMRCYESWSFTADMSKKVLLSYPLHSQMFLVSPSFIFWPRSQCLICLSPVHCKSRHGNGVEMRLHSY